MINTINKCFKEKIQSIRSYIMNNIVLYTVFKEINYALLLRKSSRAEYEYQKFIKSIKKIDSISDISKFRKQIRPILLKKEFFSTSMYGEESYLYGYYDELLNYSGRARGIIPLMPMFEHGIRFSSLKRNFVDNSLCYACQGKNRIQEIHDIDPWKMVFPIGPYIHYARDYYDKKKYSEMKKKLGKVLLVFPSHTFEEDSVGSSNESLVSKILKKYNTYDTILVCMYWKNINDPVAKEFEARGAKIVSAGFRGDKNFVRRLKTIIRIADDVVVDNIGTNIGFCLYMKKRVYFEGGELPEENDATFIENYKAFRQAFYSENLSFSDTQLDMQQSLYNAFWGGKETLLSKDKIRKLFYALENIYSMAGFRINRLAFAEKKYINECKDSEEKKLIIKALSSELEFD